MLDHQAEVDEEIRKIKEFKKDQKTAHKKKTVLPIRKQQVQDLYG